MIYIANNIYVAVGVHSFTDFSQAIEILPLPLVSCALRMSSIKYDYGGGGGSERNSGRKWI